MCTETCPCYAGENQEAFKVYQGYREEDYEPYGRTGVGMCILSEDAVKAAMENVTPPASSASGAALPVNICDPATAPSAAPAPSDPKPLIWSSVKKYSHNSLLGCLDYATKMIGNQDLSEE